MVLSCTVKHGSTMCCTGQHVRHACLTLSSAHRSREHQGRMQTSKQLSWAEQQHRNASGMKRSGFPIRHVHSRLLELAPNFVDFARASEVRAICSRPGCSSWFARSWEGASLQGYQPSLKRTEVESLTHTPGQYTLGGRPFSKERTPCTPLQVERPHAYTIAGQALVM